MRTSGYFDALPLGEYLADPCPVPSVSTGIVEALLERSPAHAYHMHPRYGGAGDAPTSRGDIGSAVHSLVLGGAQVVYAPEGFTDWRKKDAQAFRDASRELGQLPLLEHQRVQVEAAAKAARAAIDRFGPGRPEVTMCWEDDGVWCRGRADWLTDDGRFDLDLKTTDSAAPGVWIRSTLLRSSNYLQAGLRARGHHVISGRQRDSLFVVVELEPPHGVSVIGMEPSLADFADREVQRALEIWRRCQRTNTWPTYSTEVHYAALPGWLEWRSGMSEVA